MNTANNQRFLQTEKQLHRILLELLKEKEPGKITVSEVCALAGINRKTFYNHYLDIYDLMEQTEAQMGKKLVEEVISEDHYLGIGHVFEKVFEFVKENRAFYSVYLSRNSKMQVINIILPEKYQISKAETGRKIGFADAYELSYHETFFMAGLTAMIRLWLDNGCMESPKEMSRMIGREYGVGKAYFEKQYFDRPED